MFHPFLSSADSFQNKLFQKTIRVSNSLDPDQARPFVRPDLDRNCSQRSATDDKFAQCGKEVNKKNSDCNFGFQ